MLGTVLDGRMILSKYGSAVQVCWNDLPRHYGHVVLDEMVIMPNHIHGIILVTNGGAIHELPQSNGRGGVTSPLQKLTLGRIVTYYKYQTTRKLAKPILLSVDLQEKIDYEYTRIEI